MAASRMYQNQRSEDPIGHRTMDEAMNSADFNSYWLDEAALGDCLINFRAIDTGPREDSN